MITIHLNTSAVREVEDAARVMASKMEGWKSNVGEGRDRVEDALHGMAGQYAFSLYQTGAATLWRVQQYYLQRLKLTGGDGGQDLPGLNVDVKTTAARRMNPAHFSLIVSPKEYHAETVYILALAQRSGEGMSVGLVGWDQLVDKDLRRDGQDFAGKYVAHSSSLNPFAPLRWAWVA